MLIPWVALAAPYGNLLQAEAAAEAAEQAGVELALDALLEAVVDAYKPPPAQKTIMRWISVPLPSSKNVSPICVTWECIPICVQLTAYS